MTLQELSQHYERKEKLRRDEDILMSLRAAAVPGAQALTGMPHSPGIKDKVGNLAVEIVDMETRVQDLMREVEQEEKRISAFIDSIRDEQTRMIFRLRFIRGLLWREVAEVVGGQNTEQSVKAICYRYLASLKTRSDS